MIREILTGGAWGVLFGTPATEMMNRITENILDAADEYTYAELGLLTPAERRHILFEGTS